MSRSVTHLHTHRGLIQPKFVCKFDSPHTSSVIIMGFRSLTLPLLALLCAAPLAAQPGRLTHLDRERYTPSMVQLRDTLFVLDSTWVEIRLDQQKIYQHYRDGRVETHLCSTGNPAIPEAVATRPGIFTVQSKAKRTMSAQFESWLNYWIGFDGGIGMHGLDGSSYYKYLGRRPSSHGCVRVANQTGAALFRTVPMGTVVFVHSGNSARVVTFATPSDTGLTVVNRIVEKTMESRLDAVIRGLATDSSLKERLAIAPRTRFRKVGIALFDPKLLAQYPIAILPGKPFVPTLHRIRAVESVPSMSWSSPASEGEEISRR